MTPHIGLIPPMSQRRNYMAKQYGLSIKEQAILLEALCRCRDVQGCPAFFMQDVENCPFEVDCDEMKYGAWLPFLEKRVPPDDQGGGA